MIADLLISVISGILSFVMGPLPTASLGISDATSSFTGTMAIKVAPVDSFLPVHEMCQIVSLGVIVYLPALAIYVVANWIFRHFPWVGAGG